MEGYIMAYDAKAVANYFLDIAKCHGEKLTLMKLQKLIYFAHGWHLAIKGSPLIDEQIEAWPYGPVVPSIYHELKYNGKEPIDDFISEFYPEKNSCLCQRIPIIPDSDTFTRALLDKIWEVYGPLSAIQLSNMTHMPNTPWAKTWSPGAPKGKDIDNELIRKYFVSVVQKKAND